MLHVDGRRRLVRRGDDGDGEELVVDLGPDHVAVARAILRARRSGNASQRAVGEPSLVRDGRGRAVMPHRALVEREIMGSQRRGRSDEELVLGDEQRLGAAVFQPRAFQLLAQPFSMESTT